jgi:hypothetical protein
MISRFGIPTIHNGQDGRNCSNVNGIESQSQVGILVLCVCRIERGKQLIPE